MVLDVAKSVRNRLLEQTRKAHGNYQQVLIRFFHERLMYRLAKSKYRSSFYLKGGSLLFALNPVIARPTLDVDLLGINFPSKPELLLSMFADICLQACPEDGITFDIDSIQVEDIMNDKEYLGLHVKIQANLDSIRQWVAIDVGFGDSVVAEKFHAMIARDESNSRMKDFFDVYQILTNHKIDNQVLESAIKATFRARKMNYTPNVNLFSVKFANDESRLALWKNFLRKIKYTSSLNFEDVMDLIRDRLGMYWTKEMLE